MDSALLNPSHYAADLRYREFLTTLLIFNSSVMYVSGLCHYIAQHYSGTSRGNMEVALRREEAPEISSILSPVTCEMENEMTVDDGAGS